MVPGDGDGRVPPAGVKPGALTDLLRQVAGVPETPEAEPAPLLAGAFIGRFEVVRELGRGGFGVVYEARDRELGRQVALKLVRSSAAAAEEGKVAREAEAIARLSHPNLITLHDVGRSDHGPYLVFELLRGQTLQARLDDGPMMLQEAVHVATEVARGLAHAHSEGVVHRDLKPSNVFVTLKGHVKILDFGMAHAFGRRRLSGGTPAYMAPEQWTDEPEDERTDVFALGVMLHRMLSGEYPFPESGGRWSAGVATAPKLELPGAPGLADLIDRMLEKAPKGRPRDGTAVLEALTPIEEALRNRPADASPPSHAKRRKPTLGERLGRPGGRRLIPWVAAIGLGALLAVGAGLTWKKLSGTGVPQSPEAMPSIAVLPFADLSEKQDQGYFADGLTEEILNVLSRMNGLRVLGRTSSFFFKGKEAAPAEIGRRLGVTSLLEGSVRRDGSQLRVSVQLVNAADGVRQWTESYDRHLGGVFAMQDEISRDVARALRVKLQPATAQPRPVVPEAYAQYLLAQEIQRVPSLRNQALRLAALQRAVELDPTFAAAWATLGAVRGQVAWVKVKMGPPSLRHDAKAVAAAYREAREDVERAITLAPGAPNGYDARGWLRQNLEHDWKGATEDYQRALNLDPSYSKATRNLGMVYIGAGRLDEATQILRKLTEVDPYSELDWMYLAAALEGAGDTRGVREATRRVLEMYPDEGPNMKQELVLADLVDGRLEEVLATAAKEPDPKAQLFYTVLATHSLGRVKEARALLAGYMAEYGAEDLGEAAQLNAWCGRLDEAFALLDELHEDLDNWGSMALFHRIDPLFRNLHPDPRWKAFLRKLHLPVD